MRVGWSQGRAEAWMGGGGVARSRGDLICLREASEDLETTAADQCAAKSSLTIRG